MEHRHSGHRTAFRKHGILRLCELDDYACFTHAIRIRQSLPWAQVRNSGMLSMSPTERPTLTV